MACRGFCRPSVGEVGAGAGSSTGGGSARGVGRGVRFKNSATGRYTCTVDLYHEKISSGGSGVALGSNGGVCRVSGLTSCFTGGETAGGLGRP